MRKRTRVGKGERSKMKTSSMPLAVVVHRLRRLLKQKEPERGFGKIDYVFGCMMNPKCGFEKERVS
ncbi:uncharacterized protein G2W53_041498 [Senna tora]|uniref:Uncharacterized protein n=1 Tax=Senna tora TaxID=362788 RepID=A0A834VYU4_9FABA|nr:uncharacterized protein G2W53_041498 [Senna tora]